MIFRERKTSARVPPADPVSLIIPEVQPLPHEPVVVKHRVNAFFGTDLEMILRAHDIDTLVLLGHATSGVIVSTVRYAADADYRLVVVEDGCADRDAEIHVPDATPVPAPGHSGQCGGRDPGFSQTIGAAQPS